MPEAALPLFALFTALRDAGLPLGISEYELLLHALRAGFGGPDRTDLVRLCSRLWAKSLEEERLVDYHFARLLPTAPSGHQTPGGPGEQQRRQEEVPPKLPGGVTKPVLRAVERTAVLQVEDEVEAARMVLPIDLAEESIPRSFILIGDYLPITRRQMKQCWRFLRRKVRMGPAVELDVDATAERMVRHGFLLEPVLRPPRVNRAELLLLVDLEGSMVPFHPLARRLEETALRGGRLGKAGIYYFHNCPDGYIYRDPALAEALPLGDAVRALDERTAVLVFSDAGAARGGLNPERIALTRACLALLAARVRRIVWLNPMPRARWRHSSAGAIARMVPMFEATLPGLLGAIDALQGRRPAPPIHPEESHA